eukprot:6832603-Prymnesium_polylepis.1
MAASRRPYLGRRVTAPVEARVVQREQEVGVRGDGDYALRPRHQPEQEALRVLRNRSLVDATAAVPKGRRA